MRRRSTFIPSSGVDFDPTKVEITGRNLSLEGLKAAREEKLVFGVETLPIEIAQLLRGVHELHIRWAGEEVYNSVPPYSSALNSGLHVHVTSGQDSQLDSLCPLLKAYFSTDLKCESLETSFSRPDILSTRFSSAASSQYYTTLSSLQQLITKLQATICQQSNTVCLHNIALLNLSTYLDIDYDSISQVLTVTTFWSKPPAALLNPTDESVTYDEWDLQMSSSPNDKCELGILKATESNDDAPQIQMDGYIAAVGDDNAMKPTMFFAPARHHRLEASQADKQKYTVSFDSPTGLHPTMRISFPSKSHLNSPSNKPDHSVCALHTYITLPSVVFADEYAFPTTDIDPLFTEAHNIQALRSLSGERDLEVPDYVVKQWGSALLLELATPDQLNSSTSGTWDVTIPLHLRYLSPNEQGKQTVDIPWPIVFWACTADDGTKFNVNPFDRVNLGYDGLFGPRTMFYHLDPKPAKGSRLVEKIDVPVLNTSVLSHSLTETLTTLLVLAGFAWIAFKVLREISGSAKSSKAVPASKKKS